MIVSTDGPLLELLEAQRRRLDELVSRLEIARATLIPPPATFWLGAARLAYDSAISALAVTVDGGIASLRTASELTLAASYEVQARG